MEMANKRYELTDEQWGRVSGLIIHSKMGRPPKDKRVMLNAMLWMARGKQYTAGSANGVTTEPFCEFLRS